MASYTIRVHSDGESQDTRLTKEVASVGRRQSNDLLILHKSVSGRHGEIHFDGREVRFVDIGSTNGTFNEDGQRLQNGQAFTLMVGEVLQLGDIDIELMDVQVDAAPAPAPAPADEPMEATAMLSADQIADLFGDDPKAAMAPKPAAQPAAQPAPRRDAPAPMTARRERPAEPQRQAAPAPAPQAAPSQPEPAWDEQPAGGDDDWVAQAARGGADAASGRSSRPAPQRVTNVLPDELEHLDSGENFVASVKGLLLGGISGALDSLKSWGSFRGGMDDIKADFKGAIEVYKPVVIEATLPILAVNLAVAVFTILGLFFLQGVFSLLTLAVTFLSIFAYAGTYVYFLRRRIGQPISPVEAVLATVNQGKPLVMSLLMSLVVLFPAAIALILPAVMLGPFFFPVYYVEDRGKFGPIRRTLWLMRNDFKRIFLSLLVFGFAEAIIERVFVGMLAGSSSIAVAIVGLLIGVVVLSIIGTLYVAYMLEIYFDTRAALGDGDAEQDCIDNLGDPD